MLVNDFYLPILSKAVRYDRQAGYFDSTIFIQIATGLSAFISNVRELPQQSIPPMRLITGTTWSNEDIEAYQKGRKALEQSLETTAISRLNLSDIDCIRLGLPKGWSPEADPIARDRLGALAWMVATGLLDVRIALPLDMSGRPCYPGQGGALFHPKVGVLYDSDGNIIEFSGSVNETSAAWTRNREEFSVKRSWFHELDREDIQVSIERFEQIWNGDDAGLLVLPLPKAVKDHLRAFERPDGVPTEPLSREGATTPTIDQYVRICAQWLIDAPKRSNGESHILNPIWVDGHPFEPFPHQAKIRRLAVKNFPRSYLFCDEVGLGKTIEGGLVLRSLILSGKLQRVLLIAPKNLIRQWMEELREKFALTAWYYDGLLLEDVGGRTRRTSNPWAEDGLIIVSRHLIARQDRLQAVFSAPKWDAVLVDEAHAARRQVFSQNEPNQFLRLLQGLKHRRLYECLWLLTATPMQLSSHEVHDLLDLVGLNDPKWGPWQSLRDFENFFENLRIFSSSVNDRSSVIDMTRVAVKMGAPALPPQQPSSCWTNLNWTALLQNLNNRSPALALSLRNLTSEQAEAMTPYIARQTPLAVYMFRHTRETLKAYKSKGLLRAGLAERKPEDIPVDFKSPAEEALYRRIDELCSRFYRLADLAPSQRSGVGFLMAVFRKRLASSFAAFRKSLERRRDLIFAIQNDLEQEIEDKQRRALGEGEDDDDSVDFPAVVDQEVARLRQLYQDPKSRAKLEAERIYLQDYIDQLSHLGDESKFLEFRNKLLSLRQQNLRVIVFTQYLDTLDFIRDKLVARFGNKIACYSGRGGEVWDTQSNTWKIVDKAEVKRRCKSNHPRAIDILLGTDAASEGLNLQEFSALINFDLPWNPMRVEQRIGRIDRIGQNAKFVLVSNLYFRGTIEEDTYFALKDRIGVFENVVGPLQPILAEMPRIFRKLAQGEIEREEAIQQLEKSGNQSNPALADAIQGLAGQFDLEAIQSGARSDTSQEQLAYWCLQHPTQGMTIRQVPEPDADFAQTTDGTLGCLSITWIHAPQHLGVNSSEEILATFNGELADRHPPSGPTEDIDGTKRPGKEGVRLLTWGDPYLEAWLLTVRGAPLTDNDYRAASISRDQNPLAACLSAKM